MPDKRSILVIEDNEINRELLKHILEDTYHIYEAENGKVGFELLNRYGRNISLILLDIQMPVMNGYEFMDAVREQNIYSDIPVVVATSADSVREEVGCLEAGASDFIRKPYNGPVIKRRIDSLIRLRETLLTLHTVELDSLTGVYNRDAFMEYAGKYLMTHPDQDCDLVCVEVDSYQLLQGMYGAELSHDFLKIVVADIIVRQTQETILGRVMDSCIAILVPHRTISEHKRRLENLDASIRATASSVAFKLNCGIYMNLDRAKDMNTLVSDTLTSMDSVRNMYNGEIAVYDSSTHEKIVRRKQIIDLSMEAIRDKQFKVFYQPKLDARPNKLGGAESLSRWIHPELGFISPGEFIPIFESNGFIYELDMYVIDSVCSDLRKWIDQGKEVVPVSINLSQLDFTNPDLADYIKSIVDKYDVPHRYVHFEITESADTLNHDLKDRTINQLKEYGFKIELDDFGKGYSSLSVLGELPVDVLKLDMSLTRNIFNDKYQEILRSALYTASHLGLDVVAEGIEYKEEADKLLDMCDDDLKIYIQGYYYSKPLPADQFELFIG